MAFAIALPLFFIWVVGFPITVLTILYKKRKELNKEENIINYGLFIVGLTDRAYYWEVIISNTKKIIFIIFGTLMSGTNA